MNIIYYFDNFFPNIMVIVLKKRGKNSKMKIVISSKNTKQICERGKKNDNNGFENR